MLTKLNRAIVETVSGATVPNGFLEFFNQADGAPVNAYSDANGQNSLGSEVQADEFGFVSVFLYPGVYRIVAKNQSRVTITTYEHEPIFNVQAASRSGLSLQRMNHTIGNFKILQRQVSGGLSIELWGLNPFDLAGNFAPSPDNPIQISFQKQGYSATLHLGAQVAAVLPNNQSLGLGSNGTIALYVYAVYDAPNSEQSQGAWNLCVTTNTQFDESYEYTTINFLGSGTYNPNGLNSLNGGPITGPVRLLGKLEVQRNSGQWRPNPNVSADRRTVGYTGAQTEITPRGRELLIQESATEMKNVLDFSSLGHSFSELPDVPGVRFVRLNADQTVSSRSASQMRGDLGLGSMATRDTGTGGSQHRTNSQNEAKFVTLDTDQLITGEKTFSSQFRLNSAKRDVIFRQDSDALYLLRTADEDAGGTWTSYRPFTYYLDTGEIRFNFADGSVLGVRIGSPSGGAKEAGSINAERVYLDGTEVFEDASGVYTAGSGALSNAVSNMLSCNTNAEIRASIGADSGGNFDPSGTYPNLRAQATTAADIGVRTNSQNDARYLLRSDNGVFKQLPGLEAENLDNRINAGNGVACMATQANATIGNNFPWAGNGGTLLNFAQGSYGTQIYNTRSGGGIAWRVKRNSNGDMSDWRKFWDSGTLQFSLSGTTLTITDNS